MSAIPASARRKKCARAARRILFVEGTFDAPVVRHRDSAPRGVIEVRLLGARGVALQETPVVVEGNSDARRRYCARSAQRQRQQESHTIATIARLFGWPSRFAPVDRFERHVV